VRDLFLDPEGISQNRLVIVVRKGNPHSIKALEDLARPGLKVGVGNEKQCALGVLTDDAMRACFGKKSAEEQKRLREALDVNVRVRKPTGAELIADVLVGSLDAAVTYVSNVTAHESELDAIDLDGPCTLAVQPIAVGQKTRQKRLTWRLVDTIRSDESRERFEKNGFVWGTGPKK
jgi:molybdate transport system substrate-binding protein